MTGNMTTGIGPHSAARPSAPPCRRVMLDQVRSQERAVILEVAATVQFGRGYWALAPAAGIRETSLLETNGSEVPVIRGTAAIGSGAGCCYRRMAMEVLLAALERHAGTFRDREPLGAGVGLIIRVAACRRLLAELRSQVSELGLGEEIFVDEVPASCGGRLEQALAAEVSGAAGVVDVASDASKGRGPTVGLGWVVTSGDGSSFRTGSGTSTYCSNILHGELLAARKGVQLALSLNPVLRGGIGTLRIFSDSRAGLALLRRGLDGNVPAEPPGLIRGEIVRLCSLLSGTPAELHWVKGHAGDPLNELADRLAVLARRSREAGLDGAQKTALRSLVDQDAAAAVQEHTRGRFHLAA
jgi:ribonuclease HI